MKILMSVLCFFMISCVPFSNKGNTTSAHIIDVKGEHDNIAVLLRLESSTYEASKFGHTTYSTLSLNELYVARIKEIDLVRGGILFYKVGEYKNDSYPALEFNNLDINLIDWEANCSIYTGLCEEVVVGKTKPEVYADSYQYRNYVIVFNGKKYKVDIDLSRNNYLKLIPLDKDNSGYLFKSYKLMEGRELLKLIIINSK